MCDGVLTEAAVSLTMSDATVELGSTQRAQTNAQFSVVITNKYFKIYVEIYLKSECTIIIL